MPKFIYKAKTGPQKVIEGTMEAENSEQVVERLHALGYFPLSIVEEGAERIRQRSLLYERAKIDVGDLSIFTRGLSDLLDSGLTLFKALNVIREQTENQRMQELIAVMSNEIKDGKRFSDTLEKFPHIFSALFIALVRAGEVGGMLDKVLLGLADYMEREAELKAKVRAALAYPLLMAVVGIATVFILMSFVVPRLVNMFRVMGQTLPLPTLILINISNFLSQFWWLVMAILAIIYFIFQRRYKTEEGKRLFDRLTLKIPLFGELIKKSEMARFGRTLSTLLGNGVPMLVSLDTVIPVISNSLIREELERIKLEVREGATLSKAISRGSYFPPLVTNMVAVGEEGGLLERSLSKVAQSYERELDRAVKVITSLIEPAMILVMGGIVGFIVISMLLPIFQINLVTW